MFLFCHLYVIIVVISKKIRLFCLYEVYMKKIILVISVIVIVLGLGLTAVSCSNINQMNMLSIGWLDYEQYTYNIYKTENNNKNLIGTLTYTFNRIKGKKVLVNTKEFSGDAMVEYKLEITDGEYKGTTMESIVVFTSKFQPKASYKKFDSSNEEYSYESFADYTTSSKKGTYTYTAHGKDPVTSEFKKTGAYDNESLYTLIRASVFDTSAGYNLSLSVPDNSNFVLKSVGVALISTDNKVKSDYNENSEISCTTARATVSASKGQGTQCYINYANNAISVDGKDIVKAIISIQEGDYSYVLSNVSVVKPEVKPEA